MEEMEKNGVVSEINFNDLNFVDVDPLQPGTVLLKTELMIYYLYCKKLKAAIELIRQLREKFYNYQKIIIAQNIKEITKEVSAEKI